MFNKNTRNYDDFALATQMLKSQNISEQIIEITNLYYNQAKIDLESIPASKAKETLLDILEFTISRHY
jgi:geranylgeranyl pyrophosphate synthase